MSERSESIHVHWIRRAAICADIRCLRGRDVRLHVEVFHAFALLQPLQAIHPRAAIDAAGIERADAFSKEHVVGTQVTTKVEDLHSTAVCAVHLHVGDHPPARSPELLGFALPCHFGSQRELLVDAFPCL